jgi:PAS domain S-box-containing protein
MATILIVDDLSTNRALLVTLLRDQGHRLLEASDGAEGLAAVRAEHPDLVITDVLMPVMDGYELVRQLRLDPATSSIPVVFYTAHYGEREARALALSNGVAYVLTKPVQSAEVLTIVGRVLSGEAETRTPSVASPAPAEIDRDHLRLVTDKLSEKTSDLRTANARLRAIINIGLDLASERDPDRLLESVCVAARDLFGATYITLGVLEGNTRRVQHVVTCGADGTCGTRPDWIETGDAVPGILGTVVAERRTMRGDNPAGDPASLQLPLLHPAVRAFLAVPIASPGHVYGWMCLVCNEGRSFTGDDEDLVTALSGQVGRIYELEHEILERQEAESAVRQTRARLAAIVDSSDDAIFSCALDDTILTWNAGAERLFEHTASEAIGRSRALIAAVGKTAELTAILERVAGGEASEPFETQRTRKDGSIIDISLKISPMRDPTGRVIGTSTIAQNITSRKKTAADLKQADERIAFALQSADVGIWDMDYSTGVLQWSEILEAQYGLQPGTFGGTFEAFAERIHPDDRESVLDTVGKAMKSGADFSVKHRSIWPDGTVRWLSGAGRVQLGAHGEPVRAVGISIDVTERHTLEEQYHQAQKMEAVGRLAGGVAHDFNNLLTVILGFCELLLDDVKPDDPRQADITEIQNAGVRAAGLTRQLLAFSRKQIIEPTRLNLNVVVAGVRAMLGRLIGADVTIVLDLGSELAPVKADRGQVEQIIMNFAVNARDAMPGGGTLTIKTANVELGEHDAKTHPSVPPDPYVALTVTDTGTGMTPQVKARLFEPFFTTKEAGKGTGLGLATVAGIVTRSGGSIEVSSEIGQGTSFMVYFPRADAAEIVADTPPPMARPRAGTETVVVVDDAEGLRELTSRLLRRQGYTVLVAANADEALRLFEDNESIDVLLTDVVMPGASGPELTRRLVEQRPTLKVIYMSGYTEDAIAQHGVLNPGIAFLHKPFSSETLGRKIREVLDRAESRPAHPDLPPEGGA